MANSQDRNATRQSEFSHAVETLDFADVLGMIAAECVNPRACERVRAIRPANDRAHIERGLLEIADARAYQTVEGRLAVERTDVGELIERAVEHNEPLSPEGLLAVAAIERAAGELKRRMRHVEGCDTLRERVLEFEPNQKVVAAVEHAIEQDGSIRDDATPQLKRLRRSVRKAREDLRATAESLARAQGAAEYATFTGTRYMLLLPREKCRRREGIVHAASQTGESLYFEPLKLVTKNNAMETLISDEAGEVARIIAELTAMVVAASDGLLRNIDVWETLDVVTAIASFCERLRCVRPEIVDGGALALVAARHPLLEATLRTSGRPEALVPLDLELAADARVLVITGPNAGGKTITLKTVGLLVLMLQSGLEIPCAEGSRLPIFDAVFADIGDEQSIASSLSTFTSHLRHLDLMCRRGRTGTLCLIDEIGDGTDPDEGAALAIATLGRLLERGATVLATTHYGKVKSFALQARGVSNASMLFDDDDDRPLYRLLQGTAGRSRGIETARRLGFVNAVVEEAQSLVGEDAFRLEKLLSDLEASRLAIERERAALQSQSEALGRLMASVDEKERALRESEAAEAERARHEAEAMLLQSRREIERLVKEIKESQAAHDTVRDAHAAIRKQLDGVKPPAPERTAEPASTVRVGERVSLSPSGNPSGIVTAVKRNSATVDIAGKKVTIEVGRLFKLAKLAAGDAPEGAQPHIDVEVARLETTTLDVRGLDRTEALEAVDRFLDRAVLAGVREVRVVHGVGGGVLARAVREQVERDPRVSVVRPGRASDLYVDLA